MKVEIENDVMLMSLQPKADHEDRKPQELHLRETNDSNYQFIVALQHQQSFVTLLVPQKLYFSYFGEGLVRVEVYE